MALFFALALDYRARSCKTPCFDWRVRVPSRCGTEREREQYPIIFRHPRPHGRRTRSTKHKERSTKYKAQILVRQRCPQEGAPDIPVWWFRAIEQTGMSAPGVWHKFRFLSQHRPIQTLALFAKPRRVLEYGKNCRFLRRPHSQPQPVQTLRVSHNRRAGFLFATLSVMIVVSSFAGASQNGNSCRTPKRASGVQPNVTIVPHDISLKSLIRQSSE